MTNKELLKENKELKKLLIQNGILITLYLSFISFFYFLFPSHLLQTLQFHLLQKVNF